MREIVSAFIFCVVFSPSLFGATILFNGYIDADSMKRLRQKIQAHMDLGDYQIHLVLNSEGGELPEALKMAEFLRDPKNGLRVTTLARDYCNSSCTVLFVQGTERRSQTNTKFNFHKVGVAGDLPQNELELIRKNYAARWANEIGRVDPVLAEDLLKSGVLVGQKPERNISSTWLKESGHSFVSF